MARSTRPLASGSAGSQLTTLAPSTHGSRGWPRPGPSAAGDTGRPRLPVPHQHPRPRPQLGEQLPPAADQAPHAPQGISRAASQRAQPLTPPAPAAWPPSGSDRTHRHGDRQEPPVAPGHLPSRTAVHDARSGGKHTGRSPRTRCLSTLNPRVQPIRSAITVAGILGHAASNPRIRGSTPSTIDPHATHRYRGSPSAASARRTVRLATPSTLAICLIDIRSAQCSRRISAQSSTLNTLASSQLDSSQDLEAGQPSPVARGSGFTRRRH